MTFRSPRIFMKMEMRNGCCSVVSRPVQNSVSPPDPWCSTVNPLTVRLAKKFFRIISAWPLLYAWLLSSIVICTTSSKYLERLTASPFFMAATTSLMDVPKEKSPVMVNSKRRLCRGFNQILLCSQFKAKNVPNDRCIIFFMHVFRSVNDPFKIDPCFDIRITGIPFHQNE